MSASTWLPNAQYNMTVSLVSTKVGRILYWKDIEKIKILFSNLQLFYNDFFLGNQLLDVCILIYLHTHLFYTFSCKSILVLQVLSKCTTLHLLLPKLQFTKINMNQLTEKIQVWSCELLEEHAPLTYTHKTKTNHAITHAKHD